MSEFSDAPVEATDTAVAKKPFNKKKTIIASVVAGALVIAGAVGVTAFKARPDVRLVTALSNLFGDKNVEMGFSVQMTPEFMTEMGMTDADVAEMGRPGISTVADAATALGLMELQVSTFDESPTDDNLSSALRLAYGEKTVLDLTLIDRVLFMSTDAMTLPDQSPQLVTQDEIDGVMEAMTLYASLAPQLSGPIESLTTGKPLAINFEKGSTLGDAFDEYIKSTEDSAMSSKVFEELKEANATALRNSATVLSKGSDTTGDIFILSIDIYEYLKAMKAPVLKLAKDQLDVLGTDISAESKEFMKSIKQFKGKSLDIKTWLSGDKLVRMDIDLTQFIDEGAGLDSWSAAIRINIGEANITAPKNYYDMTDDLLTLGLI